MREEKAARLGPSSQPEVVEKEYSTPPKKTASSQPEPAIDVQYTAEEKAMVPVCHVDGSSVQTLLPNLCLIFHSAQEKTGRPVRQHCREIQQEQEKT